MKPNKMQLQALDEDEGWRNEVAKIEMNRLKIKKMRCCFEMKMRQDETDQTRKTQRQVKARCLPLQALLS